MNNWEELEKNIRETVEQDIPYDPTLWSGVESSLIQNESKSITWLIVPTLLIALVSIISFVRSGSDKIHHPTKAGISQNVNPTIETTDNEQHNPVKQPLSETSESLANDGIHPETTLNNFGTTKAQPNNILDRTIVKKQATKDVQGAEEVLLVEAGIADNIPHYIKPTEDILDLEPAENSLEIKDATEDDSPNDFELNYNLIKPQRYAWSIFAGSIFWTSINRPVISDNQTRIEPNASFGYRLGIQLKHKSLYMRTGLEVRNWNFTTTENQWQYTEVVDSSTEHYVMLNPSYQVNNRTVALIERRFDSNIDSSQVSLDPVTSRYQSIQIPIQLGYQMKHRKWDYGAGVNAQLLMNYKLIDGNPLPQMPNALKMRNLGVQMRTGYELRPHVMLEAQVNYEHFGRQTTLFDNRKMMGAGLLLRYDF